MPLCLPLSLPRAPMMWTAPAGQVGVIFSAIVATSSEMVYEMATSRPVSI